MKYCNVFMYESFSLNSFHMRSQRPTTYIHTYFRLPDLAAGPKKQRQATRAAI